MDDSFNGSVFFLPAIVCALLALGLFGVPYALPIAIVVGIAKITFESYGQLHAGRYSLDYIAFAAMALALACGSYIAGAVIALMFCGGEALEAFASGRAHAALAKLGDTIPKTCFVKQGQSYHEVPIQEVAEGSVILIKRGEIVPLDGVVVTAAGAVLDMANLTGESEPVQVQSGTQVRSGAVNAGITLELRVVGDFSSSTYRKIVSLVEESKAHPAPMVRLSEQASVYFTIATAVIVFFVYAATGDWVRVLAVLVIATPCPLIIAAPVAFVAGMSRAAKESIIIRKPEAFESVAKATHVFFDKTGTLTLGEPTLSRIEIVDASKAPDERAVVALAAGLEIHSLHPLGRAIVSEARSRDVSFAIAERVSETIGRGIEGAINGAAYRIERTPHAEAGMTLSLYAGDAEIARLFFNDTLKTGAQQALLSVVAFGTKVAILTGDRTKNAEAVFHGSGMQVFAEQSPEDKHGAVNTAQQAGGIVVMVGDGLNDAPALARANVGVFFSGSENGASIAAADVVILGSGIDKVTRLFAISRRTMRIAKQSIYGGIALSVIGMAVAAFGHIPPTVGALVQEGIDVVVILNALRALRK